LVDIPILAQKYLFVNKQYTLFWVFLPTHHHAKKQHNAQEQERHPMMLAPLPLRDTRRQREPKKK